MTPSRARAHAHPLRDRLLFEYRGSPASPSEVARRVRRPLNLVSYHTRVLLEQGFLELVRTERRRGGTAHYYRSTIAQVIEDEGWTELPAQVRRALILGLLATITQECEQSVREGGFEAGYTHLNRWPVTLDDAAVSAIAQLLRGTLDDMARIQAECDRRADGSPRRFEVVLMGFDTGAVPGVS